jgi:CBS domain-containing protein
MKKAKDIMTAETITATASMPVKELAKLLFDNKIGGVPVRDETGKVIGVVTESDLIDQNKKVHIPTVISFLDGFIFLESQKRLGDDLKKMAGITAGDICSKQLVSVTTETPLDEVATLMAEENVHTLPVLDGDHLVGVIGKTDIIKTIIAD